MIFYLKISCKYSHTCNIWVMGPERGNIGEGHDREILLNIKRDHVND